MRECKFCGETKPIDDFYASYKSKCKTCHKAASKVWINENRDKHTAYVKKWSAANREKMLVVARTWKARNPEQLAAWRKVYRADPENRKRELAAGREWKRANQERCRQLEAKRRAQLADAYIEDVPLDALIARDGNVCGICGDPIEEPPHRDHILPVSKGGKHARANMQLAHPRCNHRKYNKTDYVPV